MQSGIVFESKDLGNDCEDQRPLCSEAEPDDHRGKVEGVWDREGDKEVTNAGEEKHECEHERTRELVFCQ